MSCMKNFDVMTAEEVYVFIEQRIQEGKYYLNDAEFQRASAALRKKGNVLSLKKVTELLER